MDKRKIQQLRAQIKLRIGERVKKAREASGFSSQESLAESIGVSRQAISAIESGQAIPASDTLFLIAQETQHPMEFFFSPHPVRRRTGTESLEQKLDRALELLEHMAKPDSSLP